MFSEAYDQYVKLSPGVYEELSPATRVLQTLAEHDGGPLTALQISLLCFPENLQMRMQRHGLTKAQSDDLLAKYPDSYIDQRIRLCQWIRYVAKHDAQLFSSLDFFWQSITAQPSVERLLTAISTGHTLPEQFANHRFFNSQIVSSKCQATLKELSDAGQIQREKSPYDTQLICYLTRKGQKVLADELSVYGTNITAGDIHTVKVGTHVGIKFPHRIKNVNLQISIELAAKRYGHRVLKIMDEPGLQKLFSQHKVTVNVPGKYTKSGFPEEITGITVPDAYVLLQVEERLFAMLIEYDRGPVSGIRRGSDEYDYLRKILYISEVYRSGLYHQLFPEAGNSFRYLTVTSGGKDAKGSDRLTNLRQIAENAIAGENARSGRINKALQRYWFARYDDAQVPNVHNLYAEATILNGKIWYQAGRGEERYALVW
ncbi:MAG: hypothetical protein AAF702_43340 [Chloroflexota bacterium]